MSGAASESVSVTDAIIKHSYGTEEDRTSVVRQERTGSTNTYTVTTCDSYEATRSAYNQL